MILISDIFTWLGNSVPPRCDGHFFAADVRRCLAQQLKSQEGQKKNQKKEKRRKKASLSLFFLFCFEF